MTSGLHTYALTCAYTFTHTHTPHIPTYQNLEEENMLSDYMREKQSAPLGDS